MFAGWQQTAALKANRKPLLWPWPWGACLRSGLGPGAAALKAHRKPLLWPWPWGACWGSGLGPGVPAGDGVWRVWTFWRVWTVLEGVWRVWKVLGVWGVWRVLEGVWRVWRVLERLESFGAFGVFAGWQTAALKANNRKPLLWPWPRALALGCLFEKWPWPWGACGGRCLEGLEGVWRV